LLLYLVDGGVVFAHTAKVVISSFVNNGLSKLPNIVKTLKIDYYIRISQGQRHTTLISFFDFIPYLDIVLVIKSMRE
jgi:hypothetical protein